MEHEGDEIGYEQRDDVHIKLYEHGNKITLCQIKHSNDDASIIDTSVDLWNTLATWAEILSNTTNKEQYAFAFVANKENKSQFINTIIDINHQGVNDDNIETIRKEIEQIYALTISRKKIKEEKSKIEKYQEIVLKLDNKSFKLLFSNMTFSFSKEDIITKCIDKIHWKYPYSYEKARAIFDTYFSRVAEDKYNNMKKNGYLRYTYKEFRKEYGHILVPQSTNLILRDFKIDNPQNTDNRIFIKQLRDINYIDSKEEEIEFNADRLFAHNNINFWLIEDLSQSEYTTYINHAKKEWEIRFKKHYRKLKQDINEELHSDTAASLVDEVREIRGCFGINNNANFDNGVYWMLSDEPRIGWRKDWEEKYQKNKNE